MKSKLLLLLSSLTLIIFGSSNLDFNSNANYVDTYGPAPVEFSNDYKGRYLGEANEEDKTKTDTSTQTEGDTSAESEEPQATNIPKELTIHYQMDPPVDYSDKEFYVFTDAEDGHSVPTDGIDDFGMYVTVYPREWKPHTAFCFILKIKLTWAGQSTDTLIPYEDFPADENGKLEVWAIPGEPGEIDVFKTKEETQGGKILYSKFEDWKKIKIVCSEAGTSYKLYAFNNQFYLSTLEEQTKQQENYLIGSGEISKDVFFIDMPHYVPTNLSLRIDVTFPSGKTKRSFIGSEKLYYTPRFDKFYTYEGNDLGAKYTKEKTTFKLWGPTNSNVLLYIYDNGTPNKISKKLGSDYHKYYVMNYTKGGVWSCEVPGDLNGKYYTYYVQNSSGNHEVVDPYAKACGVNGLRGMILDFNTTNPEGWNNLPHVWDKDAIYDLKQPNDLSVYEVHVRDLTVHESWNGTERPGTFKAFAEKGTRVKGTDVKTGFDHIEELGVNAVQIMPFFDGANNEVDEDPTSKVRDIAYNWGYNPVNYNCIEGGYASDPFDGAVRVKELKELILALANNANHTRVIMDVVYNHMASVSNANFTKIMPRYYFRTTEDGFYTDGAGCGNEVKTEAKMMRKFIVDSVTWWATEFKIKGFRFDLMGLIDTETMREVKDALYAIDPDNVCYGEGWALGYNGAPGTKGTFSKEVFHTLAPTKSSPGIIGGFSDAFRNNIRGANDQGWGTNNPLPGWGLISQGSSDVGDKANDVGQGMLGKFTWADGKNPYQTVNYASCHDNWTLYDQLHWTMSEDGGKTEPELDVVAEAVLTTQSAVAFSNGIAFFHSGEELFRTKVDREVASEGNLTYTCDMYGTPISHNSYKSSDETNAMDYTRKISINYKGEDVPTKAYFDKYCLMIAKRAEMPNRLKPNDNINNKICNTWAADNKTGFGVFIGYNDTVYYFFFSGREGAVIGFGDYNNCSEVYNSLDTQGYEFDSSASKLRMAPRQFVVLKRGN